MRHRFFVDHDLATGTTIALQGDEMHHARVVRVREREEVEVFNGRGASFFAIVESLGSDAATLTLTNAAPNREPRVVLHLAMAIIQLEKFDLVLQKATELGVRSFIPLVTDRIEVREERYRGKAERWRRIVFEAVKQSGRALIPTIETPSTFADAVPRKGMKIVFDADADDLRTPLSFDEATLYVGPEGGWTDAELQLAREHGCTFERLGPRRLRAETAGIVATAIVAARAGDL